MQEFVWAIDQRRFTRGIRIGRKPDGAALSQIGRTVAPVSEPDFDGFDANIAEAERARLKERIADDKARIAAD